jgi:hypothetical protein
MPGILLSSSWSLLLDLAQLELLFVGFCLHELLKLRFFPYVLALCACVIADLADARNDPRALHALGESSDDVRAALVLVFFYLNVCCHMWAQEYH